MKRKSSARIRALKTLCLSLTCLTAVPMLAAPAAAQNASAQKAYDFDIGAQSLSSALTAFAAETGLQIVYSQDDAGRISSPGAKGRMTADAALGRITAGTGYSFQYLRPGVVTLVKIPAGNGADGELVTGVVSIEASQGSPYFGGAGRDAGVNGINGSRDITATEGTGSYSTGAITLGGKAPHAPKDVPVSVSVVTRQQLDDQNLIEFSDALESAPGITLIKGSNGTDNFYARGFEITAMQIDGGAPIDIGPQPYSLSPRIDLSTYDHVEVLRGVEGLFNGYGSPGGVVNLSRKRPLEQQQILFEVLGGSWDHYRAMLDVSQPLTSDGRIRARAVLTYDETEFFYRVEDDRKTILYGVLEADPSNDLTVSLGINRTRQDSTPWFGGLPRYEDGTDISLPRSTSFALPWNRWSFDTTEIFGGLEYAFAKDWNFKLNLSRIDNVNYYKVAQVTGLPVNPVTLDGPTLSANNAQDASNQMLLDGTMSGEFMLFGNRQTVSFGGNYQKVDGGKAKSFLTPYVFGGPAVDVFNFDPEDFPEPATGQLLGRTPEYGQTQWGVYVSARITPWAPLHIDIGTRYSKFTYVQFSEGICTQLFVDFGICSTVGEVWTSRRDTHSEERLSRPAVALSFDVSGSMSIYGSYSEIYASQADRVDEDLNPMPPLTGDNLEAGLKAEITPRLSASLAAYRITRRNSLLNISYTPIGNGVTCCWIVGNQIEESYGLDAEIVGEVLPGLQVSASYTYNRNQYRGSDSYAASGTRIQTRSPSHLAKVWVNYEPTTGSLRHLQLGAGVRGQTSTYFAGQACSEFGPVDTMTGAVPCVAYSNYTFTQPAYAIADLRIGYTINEQLNIGLNINNVTDTTYYQTTGDSTGYNWYGEPRSYTATLRAKW